MKPLIISNRIKQGPKFGWDVYKWDIFRPSVEGRGLVVLDLFLDSPSNYGFHHILQQDIHFYKMGDEVAKCLKAGGIIIALLGPLSVTTYNLASLYGTEIVNEKRAYSYQDKLVDQWETSYDWLDQGFLLATKIDMKFARYTQGIKSVSRRVDFTMFSGSDKGYWLSINGIKEQNKSAGFIEYLVADGGRWSCREHMNCSTLILARGEHSGLPVAVATQYMEWDGILILQPPIAWESFGTKTGDEAIGNNLQSLQDLGNNVIEYFTKREALEHAAWVLEYRAPQAKRIGSEIEELRLKSTELERQLEPFEKMLALLDGTGAALVDAVVALFDKPSEGLTVERTQKGAAFDLLVKYKDIKMLVIEVTGIQGVLTKDNRHWSDFLGYLSEHYAKNQAERVERMVFVVNTECKNELKNRKKESDITYDVKMLVSNNKICLVRSCDLYNLWIKTLEGQLVLEIFNHLFNCDGIFEPPN